MKPCPEFDVLLAEDAAGALSPAEATRVAAHLVTCAACRAERDALEEALRGAALPPVSELERRALGELPASALAALRRDARRRTVGRRLALAAVAACAALVFRFGPAWAPTSPGPSTGSGRTDSLSARPSTGSGRTDALSARPSTGSGRTDSLSARPSTGSGRTDALSARPSTGSGRADSLAARPSTGSGRADSLSARPSTGSGRTDALSDRPSTGSGRAEPLAAASAPSARSGPIDRAPERGAIRLDAQRDAPPTASGFAPATSGDRVIRRWEAPDLELLWEDTAVLDIEGALDL